MKHLPYTHTRNVSLIGAAARVVWHAAARFLVPRWERAVVVSRNAAVRQLAARVLLLLGMVLQIVLLLVLGYMVDLCLSLMELWADLARKHLELTL